ncbi:MAG: ATP-binding cassette domain-containing protein [Acidobacteriota bacterium]
MSIILDGISRRIGNRPIVQDVTLEIADGEFFVMLGPSGSGKSTILRMIAGLAPVDAGRIVLHGRDVTSAAPQQRGVGFVFQNYALFRHMTAAENVAFALTVRGTARAERERRAQELLDLVGLSGLGTRYPRQLSGGQQQRVALARALAHRPEVLLLDEPFGALDARIREELRRSVKRIQRELGVTTVFVTHDQDEAFELADRVGLLEDGRLIEAASPRELYLRPQTDFGARFVGAANLFVVSAGAEVLRGESSSATPPVQGRPFELLFRPEDVAVKDSPDALSWPLLGRAVVENTQFCGSFEKLRLRMPAIPGVRAIVPRPEFGSDTLVVEAHRSGHQARRYPLAPGSFAWVGVRRVHAVEHHALRFAVIDDPCPAVHAACTFAASIARPAFADVMLLGGGGSLPPTFGDLRRVQRLPRPDHLDGWRTHFVQHPVDLVVVGFEPTNANSTLETLRKVGNQNLLIVPADAQTHERALIAATPTEWGKSVVAFAARLMRHLKWPATLLTAVDSQTRSARDEQLAREFLSGGRRSLALMGLAAETQMAVGKPEAAIETELARTPYGLLVLGSPPAEADGIAPLGRFATRHLLTNPACALLIVREGAEPFVAN